MQNGINEKHIECQSQDIMHNKICKLLPIY